MPRKPFTIVSGVMSMWIEGHAGLPEARQHSAAKKAAITLFKGSDVIDLGNGPVQINGVALGQGASREISLSRTNVPPYGYPVARVKCVVTTARVPGVPCRIGYLDNSIKYSRKWVAILGEEKFWRWSLGIPPLMDVQPAVIRFCTTEGSKALRDDIYREVTSI